MTLLTRFARASHDTLQHRHTLTSDVCLEPSIRANARSRWCIAIFGPQRRYSTQSPAWTRAWTRGHARLYTRAMHTVSRLFGPVLALSISVFAAVLNPVCAQVQSPQDGIDRNLQQRAAREHEFH